MDKKWKTTNGLWLFELEPEKTTFKGLQLHLDKLPLSAFVYQFLKPDLNKVVKTYRGSEVSENDFKSGGINVFCDSSDESSDSSSINCDSSFSSTVRKQ